MKTHHKKRKFQAAMALVIVACIALGVSLSLTLWGPRQRAIWKAKLDSKHASEQRKIEQQENRVAGYEWGKTAWAMQRNEMVNKERAKRLFQPQEQNTIFAYVTNDQFYTIYRQANGNPDVMSTEELNKNVKSGIALVDTAREKIKTLKPKKQTVINAAYVPSLKAIIYNAKDNTDEEKIETMYIIDSSGKTSVLREMGYQEHVYAIASSWERPEIVFVLANRYETKHDSLIWMDLTNHNIRVLADCQDSESSITDRISWGPGPDKITYLLLRTKTVGTEVVQGNKYPKYVHDPCLMAVATDASTDSYEILSELTHSLKDTPGHDEFTLYKAISWSPDGNRFAFVAQLADEQPQIYIVSSERPNKYEQLTWGSVDRDIVWGLGSDRLAFSIGRRETWESQTYEIILHRN